MTYRLSRFIRAASAWVLYLPLATLAATPVEQEVMAVNAGRL
jgi:hypothetical protein